MPRTLTLVFVLVSSAAAAADADGCKDHPLVTRVPGYEIGDCQVSDYAEHAFATAKGPEVTVGGKRSVFTYRLAEGGKAQSEQFVVRNYVAALKKVGFTQEQLAENASFGTMSLKKGDQELWFAVAGFIGEGTPSGAGAYVVTIVEKGKMQQVVSATDLADDLRRTGRAVVYVHFDTGKDTINKASEPLLAAMAELLKKDPTLKVYVVATRPSSAIWTRTSSSRSRRPARPPSCATRRRARGVGCGRGCRWRSRCSASAASPRRERRLPRPPRHRRSA